MMVHPLEVISIQMPVAQIVHFFRNIVDFETWYRNKLLKLKIGCKSVIEYNSHDDCLRFGNPLSNPYVGGANMNPLISNPMMGVVFASKKKIKRPAISTTITQKEPQD